MKVKGDRGEGLEGIKSNLPDNNMQYYVRRAGHFAISIFSYFCTWPQGPFRARFFYCLDFQNVKDGGSITASSPLLTFLLGSGWMD